MDAYEKIKKTRLAGRATALDYIENVFDEFTELHGDRRFADAVIDNNASPEYALRQILEVIG